MKRRLPDQRDSLLADIQRCRTRADKRPKMRCGDPDVIQGPPLP